MRTKKIRGLKRRQKNIDEWIEANKLIDLKLLKRTGYYYCKAKIDPWSNLYYDATYPSDYRKQLFSRLLDIHAFWKAQLRANFAEFYLAIWVFEHHFIDSQVVAVVGEGVSDYEDMWPKAQSQVAFPTMLFSNELERIKLFNWFASDDMSFIHESDFLDAKIDDFFSPEDYYGNQRYYRKLLKSNTPIRLVGEETDQERMFVLRLGNVWIGQEEKAVTRNI